MSTRFYLGAIFTKEEGRSCELKEVPGGRPVDNINDSHEYVVAFLNAVGGSIYWGVRDLDGIITGVSLNRAERNSIQTTLGNKIRDIRPQISHDACEIIFHELYDNRNNVIDNKYIVEIRVLSGSPDLLYFTSSCQSYLKRLGEKKKLTPVEINEEIASRIRKRDNRTYIQQVLQGREFITERMSAYAWKHVDLMLLYPPIPSSRVRCQVLDGCKVVFAPPADQVAGVFSSKDPDMLARFDDAHFSRGDEGISGHRVDRWSLFRTLTEKKLLLEQAKRVVFDDYMTEQRTIKFNGRALGLSGIHQGRSAEELPTLSIDLFRTDYYSYRVMGDLCSLIATGGEPPWDAFLGVGLSEYLARGAQQGIHLGAGVAIILHTLQDDRLVLTRRSANSTNTAGEAGKLFMSANEGFNSKDISDAGRVNLNDVVYRALREELLGSTLGGSELPNRMRGIYVTGTYLYKPTFSLDICIYATIDCCLNDIKIGYPLAVDSLFETIGIDNCPQANLKSVRQLLECTVSTDNPSATWDEGALAALLCAAVCLPER